MNSKKGLALGQVVVLLVGFVAMVWMIGGARIVSSLTQAELDNAPIGTPLTLIGGGETVVLEKSADGQWVDDGGTRWPSKYYAGKENVFFSLKEGASISLTPSTLSSWGSWEEAVAAVDAGSEDGPKTESAPTYPLFFGTTAGPLLGHLAQGVTWAVGVGAIVGLFGQLANIGGKDNVDVNAASLAIAGGIMVGKLSYGIMQGISAKGDKVAPWAQGKLAKGGAVLIGAALAWYLYTEMYDKKETHTEIVNFECMSWQAPKGGQDCELCNDGELPCSEYRCKSLGQACGIINKGTEFERCVNQNPRDTNPPVIKPWDEKLTPGYAYTDVKLSPPGPGFKIKRTDSTDACIKAFTPIEFGILTDEPSQCKIDIEYRETFDEMAAFFGGDNVYKYNHSEFLTLPRAKDVKNSSINLEIGNEMTLYMRCRDSVGNVNSASYAVQFCVDSAPDTIAPQIKATSINNEGCVAADRNSTSVDFFTDEPSQCKWGFDDQAYDSLPYNMSCTTQVTQINSMSLYTCRTELTGVKRDGTNYFIRCEDGQNELKEDRNQNEQAFVFSLRGSNPLKLTSVLPNNTIYGGVAPMRVELKAQTMFGCNSNRAICLYSPSGQESSYVSFFDTDKTDGVHTQMLDLYSGTHTYFVKCVDEGGNVAESSTTFTLDIDTTSPILTRAYYEDDYLKVVTVRDSDCVYTTESCDFLFEEGQIMPYAKSPVHIISWENDQTYYIKCRDEFRNEPVDCSAVVRPKENFLYF